MTNYTYNNKIAESRDLETLSVGALMGVDFSSSNLNITDNHASAIQNFLKKNNILQKRNGWEEILNIIDNTTSNDISVFGENAQINGLWSIKINNNNTYEKYYIAHIGINFYELKNLETNRFEKITYEKIETTTTIDGITNEKSFGIVANDRLYVLCGKYIVIKYDNLTKKFKISQVYNDEDTYIPTTTIGITAENSTSGIRRSSYDSPNMLTSYRYNTINTALGKNDDKSLDEYKFILDTKGNYETLGQFNNNDFALSINSIDDGEYMYGVKEEGVGYVFKDSVGTIVGELLVGSSGLHLILKGYYENDNPAIDNVKIKIKMKDNTDYQLIDKCRFGVLYGAGNNRNRLFITGNPDIPNTDFHSSQRNIYSNEDDTDLNEYQDYTYFSPYDYCNYGTTNSAVKGYQIMGDGTLMVLKEKANNEPTIYFRKGTYESKQISFGDYDIAEVYIDTYPMTVGNVDEGLIINEGLYNLNNDIIMLSENGVFGISSTISASSLSSDYKYAYARSRLINKELLKYDLRKAVCCLYDNKFFLTIENINAGNDYDRYITYVADGRYIYKLQDSIDNEYEYEWFVLKNIKATRYFTLDNKLYFSNENGLFYLNLNNDNKDSYKDYEYYKSNEGEIVFENNSNYKLTINQKIIDKFINDTTKIAFDDNYYANLLYFNILNSTTDEDGYYTVETLYNELKSSEVGLKCISKDINNGELDIYIEQSPFNNKKFKFYTDKEKQFIYTPTTSFTLSYQLDKDIYKYKIIKNEDDDNNYSLIGDGDEIIYFSNQHTSLPNVYFQISSNIPCYYVTKSFNFGQSIYRKYLRSVSITNDSELFSKVNFAIITKDDITFNKMVIELNNDYLSGTDGLVDTYKNIFKADLTSRNFASSFSKNFMMKFNYIQFAFYNNDDENCVVNNFTILYTYGFRLKGAH